MQKDWIPGKTAAGVEEIATRGRRLPPRLRTLLILVDGRRTLGQLAELVADPAVGEGLVELLERGLITPRPVPPPHPPHASEPASRASLEPKTRPAAPTDRRRSLALARFYLLDAMEQSLRTKDVAIREQLRQATTRDELLQAFARCRVIAAEVGVAHVTTIETRFMDMLPEEG
ncbi:hypothetical protein [Zoogloea sp.]|uniref:hypothetical protein n=1 Tax=Zoogloea sp. TaxID=49181 RepID=UPI0025FF8239|nr:hypothetical protein [Zoogloea sp.]MCK6396206.1 hypothetical protein [Zoogloea sp.]